MCQEEIREKTNSVLQAAALKSEKQPSRGQWKRYKFKSSSQFTEQSRIPSGNLGLNADKTNKIKVIKIKAFFLVGPLLLFLPIIFLTKDRNNLLFFSFQETENYLSFNWIQFTTWKVGTQDR